MTFLVYVYSPYDPKIFTVPMIAKDIEGVKKVFNKFLGHRGYKILEIMLIDYEEW